MSGNERIPFLSAENLKRLGGTIENFIYNTYQIKLKDILEFQEFQQILQDVMRMVNVNVATKNLPFMEKNKQVIVQVRNILFQNLNNNEEISLPVAGPAVQNINSISKSDISQPLQPLQPLQNTAISTSMEHVQQYNGPSPLDRVGTQIEQSEDIFFKRLDELEQKRKAPTASLISSIPSAPSAQMSSFNTLPQSPPAPPSLIPVSSHIAMPIMPFENPTQSSQSSQHVIVAVPPPPRKGTPFVISSWDRSIIDNPERSILRWNIPLPPLSDKVGTRISGIFLSASLSNYTPFVHIIISGPGGNQTTCILSPDNVLGNKSRGWQRWSPLDVSLSYIKNISSPWLIHLKSADETFLPLGLDHLYIVSISVDITNRMATLKLASSIPSHEVILNEGDFQPGDQIWIYLKTEKKKTEIISVSKDSIDVRYNIPTRTPSISNSVHEWMNARILNYNRQWSMILDITSSGDNINDNIK